MLLCFGNSIRSSVTGCQRENAIDGQLNLRQMVAIEKLDCPKQCDLSHRKGILRHANLSLEELSDP